MLSILIFAAITLFAVLVLMLQRFANQEHQSNSPIPTGGSSRLTITSALYGVWPHHVENVLPRVQSLLAEGVVIPVNNNALGCDPAPNMPETKYLKVKYKYGDDQEHTVTLSEHSRMVLPEACDYGKKA